jgi:cardiolipin synthase (CMP-forming)
MKSQQQGRQTKAASEPVISDRIVTVPNILCLVRLAGSVVLIPIALQGNPKVFLWLFLVLAMTDWFDGKLAYLLNQRSIIGARLDSWADAALYAALLFGIVVMYSDMLRAELIWFVAPIISYLISTAAGFWKYGRWPSYHTRAAKTCWFLVTVGAVALFSDWSLWPLRLALAITTLTNIEALGITVITPYWRADVTSIYHAWRDNKKPDSIP